MLPSCETSQHLSLLLTLLAGHFLASSGLSAASFGHRPAAATAVVSGLELPSKVAVHRSRSSWTGALQRCSADNLTLLCYSDPQRVSQLAAELTFLGADRMWLRNRNCTLPVFEPQLTVNLKNLEFNRSGVKFVSRHSFQTEKDGALLPFVCTRTSVSETEAPSPLVYPGSGAKMAAAAETNTNAEAAPEKFFVLSGAVNWTTAVGSCSAGGGRLACLPDIEELGGLLEEMAALGKAPDGSRHLWYSGIDLDCTLDKEVRKYRRIQVYFLENKEIEKIVPAFGGVDSIPVICQRFQAATTEPTETPETTTSWSDSDPTTAPTVAPTTPPSTSSSTVALTIPSSSSPGTTTGPTVTTLQTSLAPVTLTSAEVPQASTTSGPGLWCPAKTVRGIVWERHNGTAVRPCPQGAQGNATWTCDPVTGNWTTKTPDLSDCKSKDLHDFINSLNVSNVPEALSAMQGLTPAFGGDLLLVLDLVGEVTGHLQGYLQILPEESKEAAALDVAEKVLGVVDDLLDSAHLWGDLQQDERVEVATSLMEDQKKTALLLAQALPSNTSQVLSRKTVEMLVMRSPRGSYHSQGLTLPLSPSAPYYLSAPSTFSGRAGPRSASFVLPAGFESSLPQDLVNDTFVVLLLYKDLKDILVNRPDFNPGNVPTSSEANSPVVSVTLNGLPSVKLEGELRYLLPYLDKNAANATCAFWNASPQALGWDGAGCRLLEQSGEWAECGCDHLTSFAVLMDVHGALDNLSELDRKVLSTITVVGCVLSIVFLSAAIVVTTVYRALWGMRNSVHRNLCMCLLFGEILFVAGIDRTDFKVLCSVVAGLLHYFFLAAFSWMFLEAVVIYILLYKVFSPKKSYARRFYAFGYGFPLLVVAITAASRPSGYGTTDFCWLSREEGVIWSFVGPVAIILLVDLLALVYALRIAARTNRRVNSKAAPPVTRTWVLGALTLVPLLGITWTFGFLLLQDDVVVVYVFTCLNTLQGVSIFVVQCLLNQSSRKCLRQSLGRYTIPLLSSSWSRRSTARTEVALTRSSTQSRGSGSGASRSAASATAPPAPPLAAAAPLAPRSQPRRQQARGRRPSWKLLRSVSWQSRSFDLSTSDTGEVCFSTSDENFPGVVLIEAHQQGESHM